MESFPNHSHNDSIIKYDTYYRRNTIFRVNPLNPLNPISEKIFKYDQIIHLITSDIVAFWAEASKLSESEITAKIAIFNHF